jgi:hypothetical protein
MISINQKLWRILINPHDKNNIQSSVVQSKANPKKKTLHRNSKNIYCKQVPQTQDPVHTRVYLVKGLRHKAEEIPEGVGVLHVGLRVAFLGVNQVRELERISDEEHGSVVAHHVPVAFFRRS